MSRHRLILWVGLVLLAAGCGGDASTTTAAATAITTAAPTTTAVPSTTAVPPTTTAVPPTTTEAFAAFGRDSMDPGQQQAYSFVSGSGVEIEYLLHVPEDYDENRAWPLILSLHGFLGTDQTLESVRTQNPLTWVDPNVDFPFVLVAPKAPDGPWSRFHEPMDELFDALGDSLAIDPEALFLTGLSTGGFGAWQWALARPERFAGVAPIAGGPGGPTGDPVPNDICRLADLPIWVAHSEADEVVPIDSNAATVSALEKCGNTAVRFTTYEDLRHHESISMSYADPDLYEWMLEQVP